MRSGFWLAFFTVFASSTAVGAALQVTPTALAFTPTDSARQLWLTNTGQKPVSGQVRVYRWSQQGGDDVLTPADDVVVAPPMLTIAAGKTQLVRIVSQVPVAQRTVDERAYRLVVDELPSLEGGSRGGGVQFLLRYSLPVFMAPEATAALRTSPALRVTLQNGKRGAVLRVENPRRVHVKLTRLVVIAADGKTTVLQDGLLGYVLAGQFRTWRLPHPVKPGRVMANVNDDRSPETLLVNR